MKKIEEMTRHEILDKLLEDGFSIDPGDAAEVSLTIQQAARIGALVWTPTRIVSTMHTRPLNITRSSE